MRIGVVVALAFLALPALSQLSVEDAKAKLEERQRQRAASAESAATRPSALHELERLRQENSVLKERLKILERRLAELSHAEGAEANVPKLAKGKAQGIGFEVEGIYDEEGKIGIRFKLNNSGTKDVSAVRVRFSVKNDKGRMLFIAPPMLFPSPLKAGDSGSHFVNMPFDVENDAHRILKASMPSDLKAEYAIVEVLYDDGTKYVAPADQW